MKMEAARHVFADKMCHLSMFHLMTAFDKLSLKMELKETHGKYE
jgi:hypothetical protein